MAKLTKAILLKHLQKKSTITNEIGQSIIERTMNQAIENIRDNAVDSVTLSGEFEIKSTEVCVKIDNVKVCYQFPH
jgi:hypothetical protein